MMTSRHTIFITGGLGYIGGRLSKYLASDDTKILVGTRTPSRFPRPAWLKHGAVVPYSSEAPVASLVDSLQGVDVVIHAASPNEHESARNPEEAIIANAVGTHRLCEAAKKARVPTFLFLSTAHVYASPLIGQYTEETLPYPKHPYAYSHLAAEDILRSFHGPLGKGIPSCLTVRLSNGFGAAERMEVNRWTLLVNDLCRQACTEGTLRLGSDGLGLRDFICMADIEAGVKHLLDLSPAGANTYNLASGESMTVRAMADLVAKEASDFLGRQVDIVLGDAVTPTNLAETGLRIDITKLLRSGYRLRGRVDQEIRETLTLCSQNSERIN